MIFLLQDKSKHTRNKEGVAKTVMLKQFCRDGGYKKVQFLPLCLVSSIIHCWRACKVPTICVLPPVWCLYCPQWSWLDIVFDIDWIFLYIFSTSMKSFPLKASSGLLHWWACSPNPRHLEPRGFAEISPTPGIHRHIYAPRLYMKHLRVYASPGNRMYEVYMAAVLSLAWGLEDWASAWW